MSKQINMRPPHIDEIFSGKQTAIPPAPGTTNWLPIAYAFGGIIVGGIARTWSWMLRLKGKAN